MSELDPYKVLQVDPEAEDEVIEAAYRRLARKYHPDAAGPDSEERMVRINLAWEMLRDPRSRAAVDRARVRAASPAGADAAAVAHDADGEGRERPKPRPADAEPVTGLGWAAPDPSSEAEPPARGTRDWTRWRASSGDASPGGGSDPLPAPAPAAETVGSAGQPPGRPSGTVLNFGRYEGWSLGQIARADLEYIEWLDRVPIGRQFQTEIDALLRAAGRRGSAPPDSADSAGLFRRR